MRGFVRQSKHLDALLIHPDRLGPLPEEKLIDLSAGFRARAAAAPVKIHPLLALFLVLSRDIFRFHRFRSPRERGKPTKNHRLLSLLAACCAVGAVLAACSFTASTPALQPTPEEFKPSPTLQPNYPTPAPTATATITSLPASATPPEFPVEFPQPGTVVLDFVALACRARWANGARQLPCPGNLDDLAEGFIAPAEQGVAEGEISVRAPVLIGLPGQGGEHGAGLFGTFPPLLIQPGDSFHTVVACQEGTSCDVEFALDYIDAQGNYQHDTGWSFKHRYGGGPVPVAVDLSPLAGQTVQLVLAVHDQGTPQDDWVLWVYPYITRAAP